MAKRGSTPLHVYSDACQAMCFRDALLLHQLDLDAVAGGTRSANTAVMTVRGCSPAPGMFGSSPCTSGPVRCALPFTRRALRRKGSGLAQRQEEVKQLDQVLRS